MMIKLTQILSHLPPHKIKELETVTQRIVETGMASMIILYGSYARGDWKETSGGRSGKKSDYDILILIKDERDRRDLTNKLFKMFEDFPTAVQPLVETLGFVNMHLRERQYFFTEIKQQGILLYTEDPYLKLEEARSLTPTRIRELAEQDFKHWFEMANNFKRSALYDIKDNVFNIAAFHLQQCVELCYTAIEMVFSRTNPYEHRLFIL
ncbi:MAG: nucleotidyltransferase domain-containing protein, partial [Bacteroidota bacterium]